MYFEQIDYTNITGPEENKEASKKTQESIKESSSILMSKKDLLVLMGRLLNDRNEGGA